MPAFSWQCQSLVLIETGIGSSRREAYATGLGQSIGTYCKTNRRGLDPAGSPPLRFPNRRVRHRCEQTR